jgi:hypothetical protein
MIWDKIFQLQIVPVESAISSIDSNKREQISSPSFPEGVESFLG